MKKILTILCLAFSMALMAEEKVITFENAGELNTLVRIHQQKHYVLLPIEERAPELWVRVIHNNKQVDKICVRLVEKPLQTDPENQKVIDP